MQAIAECWETGVYQVEQADNGFWYISGDDDVEAKRIWLKYQSQRNTNVEVLLTQSAETLTVEQRQAAYEDLVTTNHPDAIAILQPALQAASENDIDLCCQIIYWVGRLRSPAATTTLLPLLQHPHSKVRLATVSALVWLIGYDVLQQTPHLELWVDPLLQMLQQVDEHFLGMRDIVMLLGMMGDRRACQPLLRLLHAYTSDPFHRDTQLATIKALVRLQEPSIAESLHHLALGKSDPIVCLAAARALRAMGDDRGTAIINQLIQADLPTISDVARRVLTLEPDEFMKFG